MPLTLSCQPRSSTTNGWTVGIIAPSARAVHSCRGRCHAVESMTVSSMTALRTAGAGAPSIATYASISASDDIAPTVGGSRIAAVMVSSAEAMIATCIPDTDNMCTSPASANRSRTDVAMPSWSAMTSARTSGARSPKRRSMVTPACPRVARNRSRPVSVYTESTLRRTPRVVAIARPATCTMSPAASGRGMPEGSRTDASTLQRREPMSKCSSPRPRGAGTPDARRGANCGAVARPASGPSKTSERRAPCASRSTAAARHRRALSAADRLASAPASAMPPKAAAVSTAAPKRRRIAMTIGAISNTEMITDSGDHAGVAALRDIQDASPSQAPTNRPTSHQPEA